ncbi:hypothetical protein GCK72_019625 [Caenorhabditis remanei]|uniref:Uncharacterized protein n=1 Tax=Caenorhabditis remanei TaxID=31234 RepID=A0A6A5GF64_CAERE|nr:hypothetical protein GCK72_019625 [Caenorhabditis remanei]KAF1753069.1 hypothetical protein GCK72_019625 [Caenorhabditis remanei]
MQVMSKSTVSCSVCNCPSASFHFGAIVCRACAAFFRRYVNRKKMMVVCSCDKEKDSRYPCRLCRLEKCIAAGMQKSKVQAPRDSNFQFNNRMIEDRQSTSSSSPETFSRIEYGIRSRNMDVINLIARHYRNLEDTRASIFSRDVKREVNVYEFSLELKTDTKFIWKLCETTFPEFDRLCPQDKKIIFYNFYTKWSVLEIAMLAVKFNDPYNFYTPLGSSAKPITDFYGTTVKEKEVLDGNGIKQIFGPIWSYYIQNVTNPLLALKFGEMENMALFGIMLWDPAYTNINEELSEVCQAMRKIILRELTVYFEDNQADAFRFFETLDVLRLIERAEHKCQEEIELCGVYNFEVDEDMRNIVMWDKY